MAASPITGRAGDWGNAANYSCSAVGITVVIPTFNRARLVSRAIESVFNQTVKADQIIVVDDGSTDNTPDVCRKYAPAVEYVRQPNAGVSQARNHGIRLARHPWIAFLDSDDYWVPTHVEKMAAAIEATSGRANFYFSDNRLAAGAEEVSLWSKIGFHFRGPFLLTEDGTDWMLLHYQPTYVQSSVFNTAKLTASGGFDHRFRVMEDTELFCRLGIGGVICAVNTLGCIRTQDDHQSNRLTAVVHNFTEEYWKHSSMLWNSVLSRFPDLPQYYRRILRYNLASAYWRLTRFYWQDGALFQSCIPLLKVINTHPGFLLWILYKGNSTGLIEKVQLSFKPGPGQEILDPNAPVPERITEKSVEILP